MLLPVCIFLSHENGLKLYFAYGSDQKVKTFITTNVPVSGGQTEFDIGVALFSSCVVLSLLEVVDADLDPRGLLCSPFHHQQECDPELVVAVRFQSDH